MAEGTIKRGERTFQWKERQISSSAGRYIDITENPLTEQEIKQRKQMGKKELPLLIANDKKETFFCENVGALPHNDAFYEYIAKGTQYSHAFYCDFRYVYHNIETN